MKLRRFVLAIFAIVLAAGFTGGPALADPSHHKCNSGNGNGSEGAAPECDPGNSGGKNNGGD